MTLWLAIGTVALILLVPGPTNTLLMTSGLKRGIRRSLPLVIAELAGYLGALLAIHAILSRIVSDSATTTNALRLISASYLLLLAAKAWAAEKAPEGCVATWRRVLVTTLFNPKALVFTLILRSVPPDAHGLFVAQFACIVPAIGSTWIMVGHGLSRLPGVGVSSLASKGVSVVLAGFSLVLIGRVLQG